MSAKAHQLRIGIFAAAGLLILGAAQIGRAHV